VRHPISWRSSVLHFVKNGPYELVVAPKDYPGKKYRGRYCYEHHLVFWRKFGRIPKRGECLHHKDDQKRRNVPDNLELKTVVKHVHDHNVQKGRDMVKLRCPCCGDSFERERRQTHFVKDQERSFCSRPCIILYCVHGVRANVENVELEFHIAG
jgi:HNH endonuclease